MAKSNNQKAKILYLEKILRETGEHQKVSMQAILEELAEYGIRAEGKRIYDDVEVLRSFGMDIRYTRERPGGYYLAGQTAENDVEAQHRTGTDDPENTSIKTEADVVAATAEADTLSADVSGYQKLLDASGRSIKKEMKLLCSGSVQAEVRDFFGKEAEYKMKESGDLTVTAQLPENSKFYGWLTGMGGDVRILKPKKSAAAYRDYLKSLAKEYKGL